jgi:Ca-activated chloride channel family protein
LPDGQYARYADTLKGSPMTVESPIEPGAAEIRYMSGQGAKVLARRPIRTLPVEIKFDAPARAKMGSSVTINWTGPKNPGDYVTVVMKSAKDGAAVHSALAARGSPSSIAVPREVGPAEIRYMSGQGNRVLGRAPIELVVE